MVTSKQANNESSGEANSIYHSGLQRGNTIDADTLLDHEGILLLSDCLMEHRSNTGTEGANRFVAPPAAALASEPALFQHPPAVPW